MATNNAIDLLYRDGHGAREACQRLMRTDDHAAAMAAASRYHTCMDFCYKWACARELHDRVLHYYLHMQVAEIMAAGIQYRNGEYRTSIASCEAVLRNVDDIERSVDALATDNNNNSSETPDTPGVTIITPVQKANLVNVRVCALQNMAHAHRALLELRAATVRAQTALVISRDYCNEHQDDAGALLDLATTLQIMAVCIADNSRIARETMCVFSSNIQFLRSALDILQQPHVLSLMQERNMLYRIGDTELRLGEALFSCTPCSGHRTNVDADNHAAAADADPTAAAAATDDDHDAVMANWRATRAEGLELIKAAVITYQMYGDGCRTTQLSMAKVTLAESMAAIAGDSSSSSSNDSTREQRGQAMLLATQTIEQLMDKLGRMPFVPMSTRFHANKLAQRAARVVIQYAEPADLCQPNSEKGEKAREMLEHSFNQLVCCVNACEDATQESVMTTHVCIVYAQLARLHFTQRSYLLAASSLLDAYSNCVRCFEPHSVVAEANPLLAEMAAYVSAHDIPGKDVVEHAIGRCLELQRLLAPIPAPASAPAPTDVFDMGPILACVSAI